MAITSQHVTGFALGLGVSALGFYLYKKNQAKVDQFLRERGIQVSPVLETDPKSMSLKELIRTKEELEDLIAEKEYEAGQKKTQASRKKAG
jgi:hypothetical protein